MRESEQRGALRILSQFEAGRGLICVVEEASDITAIEASGRFRGRYHVLGGHLSPLDGVGPDELNIVQLIAPPGGWVSRN